MNAFVLGCGKRCGLRNDQDASGEEKQFSPLGAASGSGTELFGRPHDQPATSQPHEKKSPKKYCEKKKSAAGVKAEDACLETCGVCVAQDDTTPGRKLLRNNNSSNSNIKGAWEVDPKRYNKTKQENGTHTPNK